MVEPLRYFLSWLWNVILRQPFAVTFFEPATYNLPKEIEQELFISLNYDFCPAKQKPIINLSRTTTYFSVLADYTFFTISYSFMHIKWRLKSPIEDLSPLWPISHKYFFSISTLFPNQNGWFMAKKIYVGFNSMSTRWNTVKQTMNVKKHQQNKGNTEVWKFPALTFNKPH